MKHLLVIDRRARIPFAYVAVVILFLSVGAVSVMVAQEHERSREFIREPTSTTLHAGDLSILDLETRAYYIAHDILRDRMNVPAGSDTKELDVIDDLLQDRLSEYINATYPGTDGPYHIRITDWHVRLLLDEMNTTDLLDDVRKENCGRTYVMDNSSLSELATHAAPSLLPVTNTPYFRLVGSATYRIYNREEDVTFEKHNTFNKNLYSPLPLMKNLALRFQCEAQGEFGTLGRMIRYMVSTIAQYRVLSGYGGGGYGGDHDGNYDGKGVGDIITTGDVETALNVALLLMEARYFRDFDEGAASSLAASNNTDHSISRLLDNFVRNGSIDPADLIFLYEDIENGTLDVGRVFAQSVYSFADRFAWDLFNLFWGEEWDPEGDGTWDNEYYFDPTLDEPIVDWERIEARADTEQWCKARLMRWLEVFGKWLGITGSGDENGDIVKIEAQPEESAVIKDIYSRYKHPPMAGEGVGAPSGVDLCDVPVPPPGYGVPDYYVRVNDAYHVDGRYYLFGDASDGAYSGNKWYVRSYVRPEEAGQGDSTDARYLILGESPGVGGDDGRPHTYKLICRDDWGSGVGEKKYEFYVVEESLIEKHDGYMGGEGPYYSTFRFIVDALARSVKQQPSDPYNVESKGMMDYAAYDVERKYGDRESGLDIDPSDERFVIPHEVETAFRNEEGVVKKALDEVSDTAEQHKEKWFREGAFLNDTENPDSSGEFFLFDLMKETTDLWYEMIVNLYDGGYRDFDEDVSSSYGPEDGPEHWNNYEDDGNSQLAREQYQEGKHETESGSEKLAGSFKFRNDALRDCHYRVMEIVKTRDDALEFSFDNWQDMGSQHYRWQVKGSCGEAGILYGWVYAGSGTAAVPPEDRQMIPREVYDGTGSVEDLTPSDDAWKSTFDTYAEPIWDVLKNGNSGGTHNANNDQGNGIKPSVGETVGWSGWPETSGEGLLDDVTVEFIEGSGGLGGLNLITDEGGYGADAGNYDFNSDFYLYVRERVGGIFIADGALWDDLMADDGWLQDIIKIEMVDRIGDGFDVMNIPFLTASRRNVTWEFWHGDRARAAGNGSLFSEDLVVQREPKVLEDGGSSLGIDITVPGNGTHFVDAQDMEFPMSKDCFSTVWQVNVTANLSMSIGNSHLSSVTEHGHDLFRYNFSTDLEIDFPVAVYSGWDLESGWHTDDIDYRMSRGYFNRVGGDTPEDPFFVSREVCETVDATRDAVDWMLDTKMEAHGHLKDLPMAGGKEKSHSLIGLSEIFSSATDPDREEDGLLESASDSVDYINNISTGASALDGAGLREIYLRYFGYPATYYTGNTTLVLARGRSPGDSRGTSFEYAMRLDSSMNLSGYDRIGTGMKLDTFLDGGSGTFSADGKISPYREIDAGTYHNLSIYSGGVPKIIHGAGGTVEYLPAGLLDRNVTVTIGIAASSPIPDLLRSAIEDTGRFELSKHRKAALLGQCARYVEYFLGVLYNSHVDALKDSECLALFVNTSGSGFPGGFLNRSYGIRLTKYPEAERETALREYVTHLINNSYHVLDTLIEPSVQTSFYVNMPANMDSHLYLEVEHPEKGQRVVWRAAFPCAATVTPYLGSPWDAGARTVEGGVIASTGTRYLFWFEMDAGV